MKPINSKSKPREAKRSDVRYSLPKLRADSHPSEKLYCEIAPRLHGYIRRWTACDDDAKDVVQNSLIKAHLNHSGFQGKCKESVWIHTIARNDYYHRNELRKNRSEKEQAYPDDIGPTHAAKRNAEKDRARVAVCKLLEVADYRTGIILRMLLEGFTRNEISKILRLSRQIIWKTIKMFYAKVRAMAKTPDDLLPSSYRDTYCLQTQHVETA